MDILVALAVAFLQLASLTFAQLRQTVDAIVSTLADQYVEPAEGTRVGRGLSQELEQWHGAPVDILKIAPAGRLQGPAIGRTELRADGVGYVEVRHFLNENQGNAAIAGQIDGAMETVASAAALVFDLRPNPGGDLSAVAHLASYLFASRTHLFSRALRGRTGTIDVWTRDEVPGPRLPQLPVYVLTSADTFSAGEAFAFALQKTGRALIVGERTGGGGYSGTFAADALDVALGLAAQRVKNSSTK